jgi:hypothetical protein
MARFALTRLASLVGILLGLSVIVFLLAARLRNRTYWAGNGWSAAVVPADPVRAMVGASGHAPDRRG